MSKQTKKVTLDGLGATVDGLGATVKGLGATVGNLSAKVDKLGDKVDILASAMEAGFNRTEGLMEKGFKKVDENIQSLARMVANGFEQTLTSITRLEKGQAVLEQGQENIQLRVDSLAPQFEVRALERRVKRLEHRAGIRHAITK